MDPFSIIFIISHFAVLKVTQNVNWLVKSCLLRVTGKKEILKTGYTLKLLKIW